MGQIPIAAHAFGEQQMDAGHAFFEEILVQVTYKQWFFGAQHVDRAMNNRHIAVFEQIVALDSLTLSSPKRGTRRKK